MKRKMTLITLAAVFAVLSCGKDEIREVALTSGTEETMDTLPISNLIENRYSVTETDVKDYTQKHFPDAEIASVEAFKCEDETVAYVVNLDEGWRIISADKRMPPVLAWSDEGSFKIDNISKFGVAEWFESVRKNTRNIKTNLAFVENENTAAWGLTKNDLAEELKAKTKSGELLWTKYTTVTNHSYLVSSTNPLLVTKWGQQDPWNNKFPIDNQYYVSERVLTGCVAVAIAQILYYFHGLWGVPSGLYENNTPSWTLSSKQIGYYGSVPIYAMKNSMLRAGFNATSSRWSSMKIDNTSSYSGSNVNGYDYVGDLMMDIGERVDMDYSYVFGSGALDSLACASLPCFGLEGDFASFSDSVAMSNIISGKVLYAAGREAHNNRHAFVLDGHKLYQTYTTTTISWTLGYHEGYGEGATQQEANEFADEYGYDKPESGMSHTTVSPITNVYYYHINWGWDGTDDGYYTPFREFSSDKKIICNIRINGN